MVATINTTKVTCKNIATGSVILCSPGTEDGDHNYTPRDVVPMTVHSIVYRPNSKTYLYYAEDGTYIHYAGGRTLVEIVTQ
jgi:phospholipase/lecithinase/hemolysin